MVDRNEGENDDEITPAELADLLGRGEPVRIVDIRSPREFGRGAIPESENLPFGEFTRRIEALDGAERVVTVCPHGKASIQAMRLIESYEGLEGVDVRSLQGGIEAWSRDYELERERESEGGSEGGSGSAPEAPF
jgi:rhodanese-related sulfurtransferase